jgi:hypothetical protein
LTWFPAETSDFCTKNVTDPIIFPGGTSGEAIREHGVVRPGEVGHSAKSAKLSPLARKQWFSERVLTDCTLW